MDLGTLMSLGEMPFHYMTDRHGDQVALPCTERNLTTDPAQVTLARGFMPVLWIKGRNEIRLGSFRSVGGGEITGPWSGEVPAPRSLPGSAQMTMSADMPVGGGQDNTEASSAADDDTDLDDLLAEFDDETDADEDGDDDMDPELAALLEGL